MKCVQTKNLINEKMGISIVTFPHDMSNWTDVQKNQAVEYDVIDDLQRALENRPEEGDGASWAEGIDLIYRKLNNILENADVKKMETDGQTFDPNIHEAISLEESPDHESGEVIEVVKQGYMLGDRVLRPASVRVAS